jgi:hypothetical protein
MLKHIFFSPTRLLSRNYLRSRHNKITYSHYTSFNKKITNLFFIRDTSSGNIWVDLMFAFTEIIWNSTTNSPSTDNKETLFKELNGQNLEPIYQDNNKIYINHSIRSKIEYYKFIDPKHGFKYNMNKNYSIVLEEWRFKNHKVIKKIFLDVTPKLPISFTPNIPIPNININNLPILTQSVPSPKYTFNYENFINDLREIGIDDLENKTNFFNALNINNASVKLFLQSIILNLFDKSMFKTRTYFLAVLFADTQDPTKIIDFIGSISEAYFYITVDNVNKPIPDLILDETKFYQIFKKRTPANSSIFNFLNTRLRKINEVIKQNPEEYLGIQNESDDE